MLEEGPEGRGRRKSEARPQMRPVKDAARWWGGQRQIQEMSIERGLRLCVHACTSDVLGQAGYVQGRGGKGGMRP